MRRNRTRLPRKAGRAPDPRLRSARDRRPYLGGARHASALHPPAPARGRRRPGRARPDLRLALSRAEARRAGAPCASRAVATAWARRRCCTRASSATSMPPSCASSISAASSPMRARTMRSIIIDSAREHLADRRGQRRGAPRPWAAMPPCRSPTRAPARSWSASAKPCSSSRRSIPSSPSSVDMRYFGGYTESEIAELREVTERHHPHGAGTRLAPGSTSRSTTLAAGRIEPGLRATRAGSGPQAKAFMPSRPRCRSQLESNQARPAMGRALGRPT